MAQLRNKYVQAMLNLSTDFKKLPELERTQTPYFALKTSFFSPELVFFYVYAELQKKFRFCICEIALIALKCCLFLTGTAFLCRSSCGCVSLWYELSVVNLEFC